MNAGAKYTLLWIKSSHIHSPSAALHPEPPEPPLLTMLPASEKCRVGLSSKGAAVGDVRHPSCACMVTMCWRHACTLGDGPTARAFPSCHDQPHAKTFELCCTGIDDGLRWASPREMERGLCAQDVPLQTLLRPHRLQNALLQCIDPLPIALESLWEASCCPMPMLPRHNPLQQAGPSCASAAPTHLPWEDGLSPALGCGACQA